MRVGIIRGDMPGPVFLADLEPVSEANFTTEPVGQDRYVSRPDPTKVTTAMAGVAASIESTIDTGGYPLTIDGTNNILRIRTATSGSYTVVTIAQAAYASITTLITAVNAALVTAGVSALASVGVSALRFRIRTVASTGVGAHIDTDTVGNGSTFNTPAQFTAGGQTQTVSTAATVITACLPVGGPLDVSSATITTNTSKAVTVAQVKAIADSIAPQFAETTMLQRSVQLGNLHGLLSSSFNPDSRRVPALSSGAAIVMVQDDGTTAYTAPVPNISGAVHDSPHTGDITITGTGLGSAEIFNGTHIRVTNPTTGVFVRIFQKTLVATLSAATQGSVSATSIVIPASLLNSLGVVGSKVQVQYGSLLSNVFTVT